MLNYDNMMPRQVFVYTRYSPRRDPGSLSCEIQLKMCREYCRSKQLLIVDTFVDKEVSGATSLKDRPQGGLMFQQLPKRKLKNRKVGVVAARLDRLFRSSQDCCFTVAEWGTRGIDLHLLDMGGSAISTEDPHGKFMFMCLAHIAQMEREMCAARTSEAMIYHQYIRMRRMGGVCPYGWMVDPEDDSKVKYNLQERWAVEDMCRRRIRGQKYREICEIANANPDKYPLRGRDHWNMKNMNLTVMKHIRRELKVYGRDLYLVYEDPSTETDGSAPLVQQVG